ncbi:hypothetical protein [Lysinibacillus fusiformis]|uniref:hypothetical protein n=1 Tax=Lysinibacillus fusiformis TaxID=28031 RepID=UPI003AAD4AF2
MRDLMNHIPIILEPLDLPIIFNGLSKDFEKPNQFITFLEISAKPIFVADGNEIETERIIQLNVWSNMNYHQLTESIKHLMENAGFERILEYDEPYIVGESHYNRVLQFVFCDDN